MDFIWPRYAMAISQSGSQKVQAGPDGIDVRTSLDIERERELTFFDRYYGIVSSWRWQIFDTDIDVGFKPISDFPAERWELRYGPINARPSM